MLLGLAAGQAHAQSSVTLYGLIDEGVMYTNSVQTRATQGAHAGKSQVALVDGASGIGGTRWGITGVEDLGGGLKTIFTLENGFNINTGGLAQGGLLFGRQAFRRPVGADGHRHHRPPVQHHDRFRVSDLGGGARAGASRRASRRHRRSRAFAAHQQYDQVQVGELPWLHDRRHVRPRRRGRQFHRQAVLVGRGELCGRPAHGGGRLHRCAQSQSLLLRHRRHLRPGDQQQHGVDRLGHGGCVESGVLGLFVRPFAAYRRGRRALPDRRRHARRHLQPHELRQSRRPELRAQPRSAFPARQSSTTWKSTAVTHSVRPSRWPRPTTTCTAPA